MYALGYVLLQNIEHQSLHRKWKKMKAIGFLQVDGFDNSKSILLLMPVACEETYDSVLPSIIHHHTKEMTSRMRILCAHAHNIQFA